jgi:hypothetical protein
MEPTIKKMALYPYQGSTREGQRVSNIQSYAFLHSGHLCTVATPFEEGHKQRALISYHSVTPTYWTKPQTSTDSDNVALFNCPPYFLRWTVSI